MTTLLPDRFVLNRHQLAAALALTGVRPTRRSSLPDLPPVPNPGDILRGTPYLSAAGAPRAEFETALRLAADPRRLLSVLVNRASRPDWRQAILVQGETTSGPYALVAAGEDEWDLALLPTAGQATLVVDDLLQLTVLPAQPGERSLELGLPGYAAALALADVVQAHRLGNRLARAARPLPAITAELLEGMLQKGLEAADFGWAVTAARVAGPADLNRTRGQMAAGLAELHEQGLVSPDGGVSGAGQALAGALGHLLNTAAITLAEAVGDARFNVAHVTLFRAVSGIWLATWSGLDGESPRVRLTEASATSTLHLVRGLLEPVTPPPRPDLAAH